MKERKKYTFNKKYYIIYNIYIFFFIRSNSKRNKETNKSTKKTSEKDKKKEEKKT